MQQKAYISWSGGKDAALALHCVQQDNIMEIGALFTSINAAQNRVSMHGVRRELLQQQAAAIGLPLYTANLPEMPTTAEYTTIIAQQIARLKRDGFDTAIFGDIFLEDLKAFREKEMGQLGVRCHFPLWKKDTIALMHEFIAAGFKAVVVCVNGALLDPGFLGRLLDDSFIADLPPGVDPCGENGEFHSFVFDGPIFKHPVRWQRGNTTTSTYPAPRTNSLNELGAEYTFYYCDLEPII